MISLLYPSRNRPTKARQTYLNWINNSSTEIEVILSLDVDDHMISEYKELFPDVQIIVNSNRSLVDATNNAAKVSKGDLLITISDDFLCFPNWDLVILEATKDKSDFILKTFDGKERWICTLSIMDRAYYNRFGFIYDKAFEHMYADTFQTHIADCTGKLILRNDIVFKHDNPSYKNDRANTDALHRRNNATNRSGEIIYLEKLKHAYSFGLDIWNLNSEADLNWFKQRIR